MMKQMDDIVIDILLQKGLITSQQLQIARARASQKKMRLTDALVLSGYVDKKTMLSLFEEIYEIPSVDLDEIYVDPLILDLVPKETAYKYQVLPIILVENQLTMALSDPENIEKLDAIRFLTGKEILPVVTLEEDIKRYLREYYGEPELEPRGELVFETGLETSDSFEESGREHVTLTSEDTGRPVVRLFNLILIRAIEERTTDIHIEPTREWVKVRFRIDGRLHVKPYKIPKKIHPELIARIKILSALDITEHRRPQDGKIRVIYKNREIDIRVSTFPTIHGEKVVLRLLDKERMKFELDRIGMRDDLLIAWKRAIHQHEGIILVTGPTGSGKSSTLYATLKFLNNPEVNIVTLEDPVEYELEGISQGQVNDRAGFTFASGLRSILRQDPDIILIGEIRDRETAQMAIQAALTGHLVLATLHTNNAPAAVTRLVDIGIPRFLVASSVIAVLAQRLARRLCTECVRPVEPDEEDRILLGPWLEIPDIPFLEGTGCANCLGTGYRGRTGVHELLIVSPRLKQAINDGLNDLEIARMAREEGFTSLWEDGLIKVQKRITSLRELNRVVEQDHTILSRWRDGDKKSSISGAESEMERQRHYTGL